MTGGYANEDTLTAVSVIERRMEHPFLTVGYGIVLRIIIASDQHNHFLVVIITKMSREDQELYTDTRCNLTTILSPGCKSVVSAIAAICH